MFGNLTAKAVSYIAGAVILPLALYSGWAAFRIASLKASLAECQKAGVVKQVSIDNLNESLATQNSVIDDMAAKASEKREKASRALAEAELRQSTLQAELRRLKAMPAESCEQVNLLLNEALGL